MSSKRIIYSISFIATLYVLITMPQICVAGAKNGLMLWFEIIVPTLFPFFVTTKLILELNLCPKKLMPYYPVFTGLISGIPTGAVTCSDMVNNGQIPKQKGQMLLIICNNASPAFLISFVAYSCLALDNRYIIWICTIGSSFITFFLLTAVSKVLHRETKQKSAVSNTETNFVTAMENRPFLTILEQTIMRSFEILVLVGGYIITASLIINVICSLIPDNIFSVIASGLLEITTGVKLITSDTLGLDLQIKSAAAAALCGFGGISGVLQTNSVIRTSGMSTLKYTVHKLICGLISGLLCIIYFIVIN